jgi:hypothetical protein
MTIEFPVVSPHSEKVYGDLFHCDLQHLFVPAPICELRYVPITDRHGTLGRDVAIRDSAKPL